MKLHLVILFSMICSVAAAQKTFTVSGNVRDNDDGEDLIGVSIGIVSSGAGTVTNAYGFYSISLPAGEQTLQFSYLGYAMQEVKIDLQADQNLNISLAKNAQQLTGVVITSERRNANVSRTEMGVEKLSASTIKTIPVLMGEADVLKAIQLLPGVQATSEGSTGFSVRGGGYDQNLIMLDEATVYSAGHLMGFFSVFNNDAIKDATLYKGDIPASAGGRLSSLMDIRQKDGNSQRFSATGGIGLIASRLTLEGPIVKDKATFIVSGRTTYAGLFMKLLKDPTAKKTNLYFYDVNAKLNYRIDNNNRLFLSAYMGNDVLSMLDNINMKFGNKTATLRWNHIFSPKVFSNFTFIASDYNYQMGNELTGADVASMWRSNIRDFGGKADFSYQPNPNNYIKFGYHATYHTFTPGQSSNGALPKQFALEHAFYAQNEMKFFDKLTLKYGLRYSLFNNIANGAEIVYLNNYAVENSKNIAKGKFYHYSHALEPRADATYVFNDANSVKASYARTAQYIQLASNSAAGSPLDVWFPATQNVKPQLQDQFSLGYFRNFADNTFEVSAEAYYKMQKNVVDFKDHAQLLGNTNFEQELRFGRGRAYGLELMLKKNAGAGTLLPHFSGWISYTISKSQRQIDDIAGGEWYRSPYDKPHNISVVLNYELRRWTFGANWVFASGQPVTYPTGKYWAGGVYVPIYSGRNEFRFPAYHRLDVSVTYKFSKPEKKFQHELNFSMYNVYGRKNAWMVSFVQDENQPDVMYAEKMYLFRFIPSLTWNFKF